jgi:hypothetical protein
VVLGPTSDPTDEPRDSSARSRAPDGAEHEDLKKAAESALRLGRTLGGVGMRTAEGTIGASTRLAVTVLGKPVKAVAKWLLV